MAGEVKLKPCPFCGGAGRPWRFPWYYPVFGPRWFIACIRCESRGPYADCKCDAQTEWNRRTHVA